ncbi:MAG: 1-deoxy-D-xylulose-5-phosphate reductoisomerase [Erysipelotrichaceae bacterium]|jgi:1-deoxy-D-xylulose-5-phosphate reductoisomerase|nr:1-deoxy-D-xylulose-5-phosphate reductoisomerase [Erysipelotrichaceae bacterium]
MKKILVLGISGSIGRQTWQVIRQHPEEFQLVGASFGDNLELLPELLKEAHLTHIWVKSNDTRLALKVQYPKIRFYSGEEYMIDMVLDTEYDLLVNALVNFIGLKPTLAAIERKKNIALANKETLVVAGQFVLEACQRQQVSLLPIDSEHSAIFQCLQGNQRQDVKSITLTTSGGSFRDKSRAELKDVTVKEALQHPNWSMGCKITIDSATMMNKGFEVIEAHWLFGLPFKQIKVAIHRQAIVHSFVTYQDNCTIAQLATADMRVPIQFALSWPKRLEAPSHSELDLTKTPPLTFEAVDYDRFPLLALAYRVGEKKGNLPAVMNAANEVAVSYFLAEKIPFLAIEDIVIKTCDTIAYSPEVSLQDIYTWDGEGRRVAAEIAKEFLL